VDHSAEVGVLSPAGLGAEARRIADEAQMANAVHGRHETASILFERLERGGECDPLEGGAAVLAATKAAVGRQLICATIAATAGVTVEAGDERDLVGFLLSGDDVRIRFEYFHVDFVHVLLLK
jgi:hypothetical protein